jgi:fructoselysine and glucoselysine-specific PTS system IIB component
LIKLLRIDDRLIHGQVAYIWTSYLGINCILVANDAVIKDEIKKLSLKLANPAGVKLVMLNVQDSIQYLNGNEAAGLKILVLTDNTQDTLDIAMGVSSLKLVNVGGMRMKEGKKMKTNEVAVDQQDINNLKDIAAMGIGVEIRAVPVNKLKTIQDLEK